MDTGKIVEAFPSYIYRLRLTVLLSKPRSSEKALISSNKFPPITKITIRLSYSRPVGTGKQCWSVEHWTSRVGTADRFQESGGRELVGTDRCDQDILTTGKGGQRTHCVRQ